MEGTERTEGGGRDVRRPARDVDPRTPAPTARRASERGAGGRQRGTDIAKGYEVLLTEEAREYVAALDEKSKRIVKDTLRKLSDDPYPRPGAGSGAREKLVVDGEEVYRIHIGRTHTAFYDVLEADAEVRVIEILDIDEAHKRYGFD